MNQTLFQARVEISGFQRETIVQDICHKLILIGTSFLVQWHQDDDYYTIDLVSCNNIIYNVVSDLIKGNIDAELTVI